MSARQCMYIGNYSLNNGYYDYAIDWLEESIIRAYREGNITASVDEILPFYNMAVEIHEEYTSEIVINNAIKNVEQMKGKFVEDNDNDDDSYNSYIEMYHNYKALCRGERIRKPDNKTDLRCYLTDRGHPYLLLQPIRLEVFSQHPYVVMFHDLMKESEMTIVKEIAAPMLESSKVSDDSGNVKSFSKVRSSQTALILPESHEIISRINMRIEAVTGLSVNMNKGHCELLQISNYGMGGHFEPHHDYIGHSGSSEVGDLDHDRGEYSDNRIATLIFYLSDVAKGGSTVFPRLGIEVMPKKGSAVFWYNLLLNGRGIKDTLHAACPVLMGEKWVASYWIREIGQTFRRKCSLNKYE